MRCQDVERLILEAGERALSPEERIALTTHLAQCRACAGFRDLWEDLHFSLRNAAAPALPAELEERVRLACHQELESRPGRWARARGSRAAVHVPWPIWAAVTLLTVLTAGFLVPGIEEFLKNQTATLEAVLVLGLILQNALMLFFTPVIMRRGRVSRSGLGEIE